MCAHHAILEQLILCPKVPRAHRVIELAQFHGTLLGSGGTREQTGASFEFFEANCELIVTPNVTQGVTELAAVVKVCKRSSTPLAVLLPGCGRFSAAYCYLVCLTDL